MKAHHLRHLSLPEEPLGDAALIEDLDGAGVQATGARADELRDRGMACILLWMSGGPSQFETFSPKPGHANGGETKAIDTSVAGIQIADNLPHMAKVANELAIIPSHLLDDMAIVREESAFDPRTESFAKDPKQTELIAAYEKLARPLAQRVVGRIGGALTQTTAPNGESALGQVIADAQLAATRDAGAQIALMNPGGIRAPLPMPADGQVRYENLFSVQPFYNNLVTLTLTGAQLVQVLEQQWLGQPRAEGRPLQVSKGFSYTWDAGKPAGQRVLADSLKLDGQPIGAATAVRVTVNGFLAGGGDNFTLLKQGGEPRTGMMDVDALEAFLKANPTIVPGPLDRVTRLN